MSRVGKQLIEIPEKTDVSFDGPLVTVKGPHGELSRTFKDNIKIDVDENNVITLTPKKESRTEYALWGTYASHLINMIQGVNTPYEKKLVVEGVGYRAEVSGETLTLHVGFSHPVQVPIPKGLSVSVEKNTISISGIDKEAVGQFAGSVRAIKKPEPYKGKGIRYEDETVRRKQGKKTV